MKMRTGVKMRSYFVRASGVVWMLFVILNVCGAGYSQSASADWQLQDQVRNHEILWSIGGYEQYQFSNSAQGQGGSFLAELKLGSHDWKVEAGVDASGVSNGTESLIFVAIKENIWRNDSGVLELDIGGAPYFLKAATDLFQNGYFGILGTVSLNYYFAAKWGLRAEPSLQFLSRANWEAALGVSVGVIFAP